MTFSNQLNTILLYGTNNDDGIIVTGDQLVDSHKSPRTLTTNSPTQKIQYDPVDCFKNREGDCDIQKRIYSINGKFNGLEALYGLFMQSCILIVDIDDSLLASSIKLSTTSIQDIASLFIYDLVGGCSAYSQAIVQKQTNTMAILDAILIVLFALSLITALVGFIAFLIPTRTILFTVAEASAKMHDIDPAADASDRTGMSSAAWKEEYSCDCVRVDKEHQIVLITLAGLCYCIDGTMNITEQYQKLNQLMQEQQSQDGTIVLEIIDKVQKEREELRHNLGSSGGDQKLLLDVTNAMDETRLHELSQTIIKMLAILVRQVFNVLSDEEVLMKKYRIPLSHYKNHELQHAQFLRKVQTISLQIASNARVKGKPIPSTHSQTLIQLFSSWLIDHVSKIDREMSALLIGKAPESELERHVPMPLELVVPPSYLNFLDSDFASIQDKNLFERLKKVLRVSTEKISN
ncbi:MAG: hypothetical protein EZS28_015307 [Streblomastix strix]|uniref:Hemerythrin-like domain-containing protein n=1 Tax=Streblomastix strix TaxID=222440 RepID=A0A5J4W2W3_9EUKA|nr:MAG: hypothetical protein EZS28_015307 [Streblomastix strix]